MPGEQSHHPIQTATERIDKSRIRSPAGREPAAAGLYGKGAEQKMADGHYVDSLLGRKTLPGACIGLL